MKNTNVAKYRSRELPSGIGVYIESLKGRVQSFVPLEAIEGSRETQSSVTEKSDGDPYSEDRIDRRTPPVDSSEETLGG